MSMPMSTKYFTVIILFNPTTTTQDRNRNIYNFYFVYVKTEDKRHWLTWASLNSGQYNSKMNYLFISVNHSDIHSFGTWDLCRYLIGCMEMAHSLYGSPLESWDDALYIFLVLHYEYTLWGAQLITVKWLSILPSVYLCQRC